MKIKVLFALLCAAVMLYSCSNNGDYRALDNTSSDTALVSADSVNSANQKLIKTADLNFKVENVRKVGE